MLFARFRKSSLLAFLGFLLVVSAPSADRVQVMKQDLVFTALDGSAEDLDGLDDGVWTVPGGMVLEGRLVCGEAGNSAPCAMALRVEGDLVVRAGGGVAADAGLRLAVDGEFRLERGSFVVAERGAIEVSARGGIAIDGLVSANPITGPGGDRARGKETSPAAVVLESTGGPGKSVRVGSQGTVLATGDGPRGGRVELSGCGVEIRGLVATVGTGPAAGVVMRSCEDLTIDGRDRDDVTGQRRGRVEVQGSSTARIDLFAAGSVRLDGTELRASDRARQGAISVTAERGRLEWRHGLGTAGSSGAIRLTACEGIDFDGSRLAPEPSLVEACAGVPVDKSATGLVELPPGFSGSGLPESSFPGVSGGTCTPNLAVDNMVISTFQEFISCNVLTSSNTRIIPRGRVTFKALTAIELGNGFSVEGSSHFTAIIDPTLNQPPSITSDGGGPTAMVSVPENTTAVTDVDATDLEGETESGGGLTYSLSGADGAKFSIDADGMLAFVAAPDFDNPGDADSDNDYEVTVTVTDTGLLTDTQDITVTVTDVNEAPVITSDGGGATASVSVDENQTAVTTVTATDEDVPAQTLTFSITGGADMTKFSIVAATGVLTFAAAPDFEIPGDANMDNDYEVQVTVTDDGAPNLSDVQDITVTVDDANDAPTITSDGGGATASKSIAENTTAVTDVDATDPEGETESGGGLTYSLSGADGAKFSIDAAGMLAFVAPPDFDIAGDANADNDYEVTVTVTDTGLLTGTQDITVTVTGVNEAPVITSDGGGATASVSVDENQTAVTTVTATDEDVPAQTLTFSITGGADQAKFSIVGATGVLTFAVAPDFEMPGDANMDNDYEVQVTVTDDGAPNLSDVQDITVTVDDANDAPVITSDGGGATASVSVDENTTAVTTVTATDADAPAQTLTFSISGGADQAKFSIVGATGVLTFATAPDFDIPGDANMDNDYEVQVTVTDNGAPNLSDIQDITVTVDDVNEAPVITSDGGGGTASVSVDENQTAVTTVTATDADVPAQTLTFSITGGADQAKFSIVGTTGMLTFLAAPDFESPGDADSDNDYEVQVTVTDDGTPNLSDVQDITVTVEDANDAPVITSNGGGATASVSVQENTTAVTTVTATDTDMPAQTLTYSISGGADQAKFSIVGATGVLTFASAPNFEIPGDANMDNDYEVEVTVTDNGTPNATDVQAITVTVDDVNEAPVITSDGGGPTASVSVDENTTAVTTVTATDADVPAQTLTYSITGGADMAKFSIVGATGVLTFAMAPNFEMPGDANMDNDYQVQVTATDNGAPNLSDVQDITVTVDNVDEAPVGGADTFDFVGNTLLLVDKTTSGSPEIIATTTSTNGVLDNDFDPEMSAISVSGIFASMMPCADMMAPFTDCPTTNGGKVTMESTGEFSYTPKAGDTAATDMFGYKVSDGVNTNDVVVTLTRKNRVWYVKNDNMSGSDDGTSADPFDTLAEASTASLAGDTIFVFEGDATSAGQAAGISLKTMQRLLGEGVALTVPDTVNGVMAPTLFAAGNKPLVEHAIAMMDGITVDATTADHVGVEIRGLAISGARNAIDVTSGGTFAVGITITDNLFDDAGAEAIDLNPGGSGDFVATIEDNTFSTSSPTGNAIDVITTAGAGDVELAINNNTDITSSSGAGINVNGALGTGTLFITGFSGNSVNGNTAGTGISIVGATFDSDTSDADFDLVAGGATAVGSIANPVGGAGMILGTSASAATRVSGNLSFSDLDIYNAAGTGLGVAGSGVATGGSPPTAGFQIATTTGTIVATGGPALDFDPLTANATLAQVSSSTSPTTGVSLENVAGAVTLGGAGSTISGSTGTAFLIDGGTATVSYAGTIANTSGFDAEVKNRPAGAGNVTFSGAIGSMATPTTGLGISVASNAAGTIGFSGGVNLNTGANGAVNVTSNTGATINFTGGLDIDTTAGTGFNGTSGGTLNVTGTNNIDSTTGRAMNLDGITIGASGMTFATVDKNAGGGSVVGIDLNNVDGGAFVVTGSSTIVGTAAGGSNHGIDITGGSSSTFTFASATIDNTGGAGINLNGANGTVTFTTVDIDGTSGAGIDIASNSNAVNVNGGTIGSSNDPAGNAVDIAGGSGNVNVAATITNATARAVEVTGKTAGTASFSGAINEDGTGINLDGNTGGTINFSGGMTLDTGSNTAFNATGGGTVNVTGTNTIGASTASTTTAINIVNTNIGASDVTFQSVSVSGGTTGIVLDTTGTAGGLKITGTAGGDCGDDSVAFGSRTCTGGVIQNTTTGISLIGTSNVSLSKMRFHNISGDGVFGHGLTDGSGGTENTFEFKNSEMVDIGTNASFDNGIDFGFNTANNTFNISGGVLIDKALFEHDNIVSGTASGNSFAQSALRIENQSAVTLNLDVTDTVFRETPSNADDAIKVIVGNASTSSVDVSDSVALNVRGGLLFVVAEDNGTSVDVNFERNEVRNTKTTGTVTVAEIASGVVLATSNGADLTFDILNNCPSSQAGCASGSATAGFYKLFGDPIDISANTNESFDRTTFEGRIVENRIENSTGDMIGIFGDAEDGTNANSPGAMRGIVLIDNNVLEGGTGATGVSGQNGIDIKWRDGKDATAAALDRQLDLTITNNSIGANTALSDDGINGLDLGNETGTVATALLINILISDNVVNVNNDSAVSLDFEQFGVLHATITNNGLTTTSADPFDEALELKIDDSATGNFTVSGNTLSTTAASSFDIELDRDDTTSVFNVFQTLANLSTLNGSATIDVTDETPTYNSGITPTTPTLPMNP